MKLGSFMPQFSPLTLRRWNSFFRQKRAWVGLIGFLTVFFFSMTAEFWSNSKPILLKYEGHWYAPVATNYSASTFGVTDSFVVDYRELVQKSKEAGKDTWALFPVNAWDPLEQTSEVMVAPSRVHWLGTDSLGRDVTARLLYGLRVSLAYGLMFWAFCFLIGVTVGLVQGYFAGGTDFFTERLKELIEILPFLSVVILVNGLMKSDSFWLTLMVVVFFSWAGVSSQLRAQVLSLRKREFVEAARAAGSGHARIIFTHILPNALTPILTLTPFTVSGGIATLAVLDYLGFGLAPPTPSLGELLQEGRIYIQNAVWLLITPTVALSWMLISINLIGESLREAFDPRK
ncbi:MAG: ABC transporter permease subunit [Bdellovibrionales bacterium]|nr:ABC transporter permease subunit [Oligoflexia bacterium]